MFDRIKIKKDAKARLKGNYITMLAAAFVISGLSVLINYSTMRFVNEGAVKVLLSIFSLIVTAVLSYAYAYLCIKTTKSSEPAKFSDFTEGMSHLSPAILGHLWQILFIFLWSLAVIIPGMLIAGIYLAGTILKGLDFNNMEQYLENMFSDFGSMLDGATSAAGTFVVAGLIYLVVVVLTITVLIIKKIQYSQMPFILSENPGMSVRRAMRLSIEYTKGNKGNLFILALSFIGWILLAMIPAFIFQRFAVTSDYLGKQVMTNAFTICLTFLMPYIDLAYTYAYYSIKQEAFETGRVKEENLQ